ncbi:MAG: hypothetical protein AAGL24_20550 [Pseudomonadota bacterium]
MALAGTGAVAIWHDIAPEGRDAFYAWHGQEHMPERIAIPGFRRGRRYVALEADLEFFNLYEVSDPSVLTGADYKARLNDPTPWTVETVRHFRDVARSLCRVAVSAGSGGGGLVATWRYDVPDDRVADHADRIAADLLPDIAGRPGVAGAHLLVADTEASAVDTKERQVRGEANRIPGTALIIEGWGDVDAFTTLCGETPTPADFVNAGVDGPVIRGLYRLQASATP